MAATEQHRATMNTIPSTYSLRKMTWVVALSVILNPLNSSMIAVALLGIGASYGINVATATWLITGFYLAAAAGQPLMGKLADLLGARRVMMTGLTIVVASSLLSVWAPSFGWLLAFRIMLALGSTVAFPAGMAIVRSFAQPATGGQPKGMTSSLGIISVSANVMAAFGPTLGGLLVQHNGWHSIFWINIPIALAVIVLAYRWMPADRKREKGSSGGLLKLLDVPGVLLFMGMLISFMLFLTSLGSGAMWWLLAVVPVFAVLFGIRELKTDKPFIDLRMLGRNVKLQSVYAQFAGLNIVFYSLFFSMPLWLGQVKGYDPQTAGLLMLPFAGIGMLATPIAVRIIQRWSYRPAIIAGSSTLLLGTLLLLFMGEDTPIFFILLATSIVGITNGMNNMGLQTALYQHTKPSETGAASGLFQTFRSVGGILSTSLLGIAFGSTVTTAGLHTIALVGACIGAVLLVISLTRKLN
ncbi:MFS transporter [Paenibacillus sp. NPDC057967]|uniref:MFS transporter n=1 Tax=Paenibacillus sp. NPDC057967 TaxID=3346293 RepID=UPI0036D7EC56